jgi:glutamyl-tRNA synthetase
MLGVVARPPRAGWHTGEVAGRFAPSPTGDLHLGNLRTAIVAWLAARSSGRGFVLRYEDLDQVNSSPIFEASQWRDLQVIGIDVDRPAIRQSERFDAYRDAIATLAARDLVYGCYCTRREILEEIAQSVHAPNGPPDGGEAEPGIGDGQTGILRADGAYPGTCRELSDAGRRRFAREGRQPALRLRADHVGIEITDIVRGNVRGIVDDVVLQRNDGVPAYNLAVVIDDAYQQVTQVVRADDLLSSTPRQVMLQRLLGLPLPEYLHVSLVVGSDGTRLAKRHGAVTLTQLVDTGLEPEMIVSRLLISIGIPGAHHMTSVTDALECVRSGEYDWSMLPEHRIVMDDLVARL